MPHILMPYTVHLDHTLRVTPLSTLSVSYTHLTLPTTYTV